LITILADFGTPIAVAEKMQRSSRAAFETLPVMEKIGADMIRVTDVLWRSRGGRSGKRWKPLDPATKKRKGNTKLLFTAGSNPGYTPHPGENILADSVTKVGSAHQILNITNRTIEFGTDVEYARAQFIKRPFIDFTVGDRNRWARMIVNHTVRPFTVK
jgi:hypothetical protein